MNPESSSSWDALGYDSSLGIVSRLGKGVVDLLDPSDGERILDLGCGTGHLTAQIAGSGAETVGLDSSASMIGRAREHYPHIRFELGAAESLAAENAFDAVFSNAALHWMTKPETVAKRVAAALRPGGRFVAEMGGSGNVRNVIAAIRQAFGEFKVPRETWPSPWYFPTIAEYASVLSSAGLELTYAELFDRPTPIDECPSGLTDWLRMFARDFLDVVPKSEVPSFETRVAELAAESLVHDGRWLIDYRRLRFRAVKPRLAG